MAKFFEQNKDKGDEQSNKEGAILSSKFKPVTPDCGFHDKSISSRNYYSSIPDARGMAFVK